jgi:hypothetical protein
MQTRPETASPPITLVWAWPTARDSWCRCRSEYSAPTAQTTRTEGAAWVPGLLVSWYLPAGRLRRQRDCVPGASKTIQYEECMRPDTWPSPSLRNRDSPHGDQRSNNSNHVLTTPIITQKTLLPVAGRLSPILGSVSRFGHPFWLNPRLQAASATRHYQTQDLQHDTQ